MAWYGNKLINITTLLITQLR
uniref:Uncharacterized protein n=1 Tax=Arundo donax TaxID=35708 RepID=A0A0A9AHA3_ARUDO